MLKLMKNTSSAENMHILRWLGKVTGKNKLYLLLLVFTQALLGGMSVYYAVLLRNSIDKAVAKDLDGFWFFIGFAIVLVVSQILLRAVYRYFEEKSKATIENLLKRRLSIHLFYGDYEKVTATHSGEWLNRITSDTVVVTDGLVQILPGIVGMVVKMLGALLLILYYLPGFGIFLLVGGVIMIGVTYGFRRILKRLHKSIQEADGDFRSFTQENLTSLMVVKSFGKEERITEIVSDKMETHKKARIKKNHFSNVCNIGFSMAMNGMYLLGLIVSGYGIITDTLSYGTLMAVLQLISQIQSPFANITGYLPKYYSMLASAERIMEVEYMVVEGDKADKLRLSSENVKDLYENHFKGISVENVSFLYQNNIDSVLTDFSMHIEKGKYIALLGSSGCGKSTFLKLLMSMYKIKDGKIFIETDNEKIVLDQRYRGLFAYVPQGNFLMSGSIKDVITFFDKNMDIDEKGIYKALRIACAEDFVRELPQKIDTILGERGVGLSEGQMQRIAIARAIYCESPILLLDESTSALDESTQNKLLRNLRELTDKTVIIVTHRQAALEICDKVINMGIENRV